MDWMGQLDNIVGRYEGNGTLTDSYEGITRSLKHALERLERSCPDAESLRVCIGPPLRESLRRLLASDNDDELESAGADALCVAPRELPDVIRHLTPTVIGATDSSR